MLAKPAKGSATRARRARARKAADLETHHKQQVRDRDRRCRFPLCGCMAAGFRTYSPPTVSHDKHKGMGGNPTGDRSLPDGMILLCQHRHQDGAIARDRKNLRPRSLTEAGNRGPVAWDIKRSSLARLYNFTIDDMRAWPKGDPWIEVARERAPHSLERLLPWQLAVLSTLAEMQL